MNYIKELNALYDRQEQTPISGSAIALWSALMNINNKTRWKNTFTSPATVLRMKAGLTESTFKRARAELIQAGYIKVESQGRGRAPVYTMYSLVVESVEEKRESSNREIEVSMTQAAATSSDQVMNTLSVQPVNEEDVSSVSSQEIRTENYVMEDPPTQEVNHVPTHPVNHLPTYLPDHEPAPLIKQYKTKQKQNENNINTAAADAREQVYLVTENNKIGEKPKAILFYQENFRMVGPFVTESLMDWIRTVGEALVVEAMKRALERNKISWSYVKGILSDWGKKGIRTIEQAKAEQVAFEKERSQKRSNERSFFRVREDIVPDWYEAEKERQRKKWERQEVRDPEEEKRMRERVEEMLREFGA